VLCCRSSWWKAAPASSEASEAIGGGRPKLGRRDMTAAVLCIRGATVSLWLQTDDPRPCWTIQDRAKETASLKHGTPLGPTGPVDGCSVRRDGLAALAKKTALVRGRTLVRNHRRTDVEDKPAGARRRLRAAGPAVRRVDAPHPGCLRMATGCSGNRQALRTEKTVRKGVRDVEKTEAVAEPQEHRGDVAAGYAGDGSGEARAF
jgi:hypothetical protein